MNHQSSFSLRSFFQPVDLTQGTCWKTLLVFAFPIIVSYLLQQVYSISDAAIVGQTLTASEVAGVNDTTSLAMIFLQFAFGASAGFCTVTSCFVGARDSAGVRRSMATQIVLSAALTAVLTALALALLDPMLAWINVTPASGEVYRAAYTYCAILFGGIGAQLFYNFICSFLRSMGDSATPLAFLLFSTILNVGLDLLFILSFHWGVAGVAIATAIAYTVSAATLFIRLLKTDSVVRVTPRDLAIDPVALKRIVKIGLPAGIQSAVFAVANIIIQSAINSLGTEVMAASSAAMSLEYVCYNLLNSFSQACTTFVGQNHGARQIDRCTKTLKVCLVEGGIVALTTIIVIVGLGREILSLFNSDPNIVSIGYIRVCSIFPAYAFSMFYENMSGYLRGFGISLTPALITMICVCGIRFYWVFCVFPHFRTFANIMMVYPISLGTTAFFMVVAVLLCHPARTYRATQAKATAR